MENFDDVDEIDGTYGGPYMVEKILGIYVGKNRKKYYRVKWVDSWEPEDNLSEACQPLIDEFWSSPIHDATGGEVNRTDLKSGQKIIKKETKSSSDDSNPESPEDTSSRIQSNVMPTLKSDLGSPKQTSFPSNPTNLKQELMSPTVDTENKTKSTSKDTKTPASDQNPNVSFPSKRSTSDSCLQTETQTISDNLVKKTFSSQCVSTEDTTTPVQTEKRKSVDCQTQTSDHEEDDDNDDDDYLMMSNQTHHSIQTSFTQTDTQVINPTTTTEQIQEIDLPSDELSFSESDVVDLASEEENDVEITLSTPSKRQCIEKQQPASSSCVERRSRVKITQRRRRNSDSETTTQHQQTRPPLHPRSLLPMMPASTPDLLNRRNTGIQQQHTQMNFQLNQPSNNMSGRKRPINLPSRAPEIHSSPVRETGNMTNKLTDRTCNICKHTFPNLTLARQHVKKVHISSATPVTPDRMVRNLPVTKNQKNISTTPNQPQQRSQQQQNAPELTCTICFAFFRNNRDLKSHMLLHTEKNLQKCEICLRSFKNKTTLHQHMLIHSDELPHECQTCGKRFRQQGHLILHMGKHTQNNEGTLVCPHCSLEYSDNNEFRNHVRSHESELPFKCNQCLERFGQRNDLMRHLEEHNEGRPFTCPICKKSFKTKTYLLGHMQMHKMRNNDNNFQPRQPQNQGAGQFTVKTDH